MIWPLLLPVAALAVFLGTIAWLLLAGLARLNPFRRPPPVFELGHLRKRKRG